MYVKLSSNGGNKRKDNINVDIAIKVNIFTWIQTQMCEF